MNYAVLVEGPDDNRFIENVIRPNLYHRRFSTMQYSEEPDQTVDGAIRAFQGMHRDLYLLRDYDYGKQDCTCIEDRKGFVTNKFNSIEENEIIVVDDAIEAWYLAGVGEDKASELGIQVPESTDGVGKEVFKEKLDESRLSSRVNFQMSIIDGFSIQDAKSRNSSFSHFADRIGI